MATRKIIEIDEALCNGCGACISGCAEGALKLVNGKAKVVSENFCDGLGACLGTCPTGALTIVERDAAPFDEEAVKAAQAKPAVPEPLACGCPGTMARRLTPQAPRPLSGFAPEAPGSQLAQWPVQLRLIPESGPQYQGRELLLLADCVAVAYPDLHRGLLAGRSLALSCPKLDDPQQSLAKLTAIFKNPLSAVTVAIMEVPCCGGLLRLAQEARAQASAAFPIRVVRIAVGGEILERYEI